MVSSFESANTLSTSLCSNPTDVSVNSVSIARKRSGWCCYGCGSNIHHQRFKCPAYQITCHKCGKTGHFAKVCKSSGISKSGVKSVKAVDIDDELAVNSLQINAIHRNSDRCKKTISLSINGKSIPSALIDSGSDITVLSLSLCKRLSLSFTCIPSSPKAFGANGAAINLVGRIDNACVETGSCYFLDTIWIAESLTSEAIFGHSSLSAFQALTIRYGGHLPPLQVQEITIPLVGFALCPPVSCFPIKPSTPIRAPSRLKSLEDRNFIKAEIQRLLQEGKIQPSNSAWHSQAFVIRDANKKPRMVIDYAQTVNRSTQLDAYPIPLMAELLDQLSRYSMFSYIDLKAAFHQIPLQPDEYSFTAFEANNQLWEFKCMPFGLRNSPAAFCRALQNLIGDLSGIHIYMDDIVIGGNTQEEHNANLQQFLDRAASVNLTFSKEKSVFNGTRLHFLGHIITSGTISPDPDRSAPFVNFPTPTTLKQTEAFCGPCSVLC